MNATKSSNLSLIFSNRSNGSQLEKQNEHNSLLSNVRPGTSISSSNQFAREEAKSSNRSAELDNLFMRLTG